MPQPAVRRPFGELDLDDQRRLHPVRSLVGGRPIAEWTRLRFQRPEQLHQTPELALIEAGPRVTRVSEPTPVFVNAQEERAEVGACLPRLGPAADHELLLVDDLQ